MAIRRFRDHVADQNWFAVLIDVGIVVVGVFLGIQASNWNAARIERGELSAYRTQIVGDLIANEQELAERARYYRRVRDHALAAMGAIEGSRPRGEAFLVDLYQASQVSPIRMERSAYDEMLASGMAKSVGDPAIRRRLSAYYAGTDRLEEATIYSTGYRDWIRREMAMAVQRRMRERCSDVVAMSPDGIETITLPPKCRLELAPEVASRAAQELGDNPELMPEIARHIGDLDIKIARFDRWLQVARDTRRAIEEKELS
jgi:hypothetical protein